MKSILVLSPLSGYLGYSVYSGDKSVYEFELIEKVKKYMEIGGSFLYLEVHDDYTLTCDVGDGFLFPFLFHKAGVFWINSKFSFLFGELLKEKQPFCIPILGGTVVHHSRILIGMYIIANLYRNTVLLSGQRYGVLEFFFYSS